MFNDFTYRVAFVFALILHLIILFFLFAKPTSVKQHQVGLVPSHNIINATAISEPVLKKIIPKKKLVKKKVVKKKRKTSPVVKKKKKKLIKKKTPIKKATLKKNLLAEKKKKEARLEKERKKRKERKERKKREEELIKKKNKQKELEMQKMKELLQQEILEEQKQLTKELNDAKSRIMQGRINKHSAIILQAIGSQWIKPDGVKDGDFSPVLIEVAPGGVVMNVQLLRGSGNLALDRSAKAAVLKASPLPMPEDLALFNEMRTIKITFKHDGVLGQN